MIERTLAEHGMAALEMPMRAAALHEAGHAVLYAAESERVKSVRIKSRNYDGKRAWGGSTLGGQSWTVGTHTDPAGDLRRARLILAGVAAEMTFDPDDFRQGSSLDEIVLGRRLCDLAAVKLARHPSTVLDETMTAVRGTLLANEAVVLALASALERRGWVRGAELAAILAPVREARR